MSLISPSFAYSYPYTIKFSGNCTAHFYYGVQMSDFGHCPNMLKITKTAGKLVCQRGARQFFNPRRHILAHENSPKNGTKGKFLKLNFEWQYLLIVRYFSVFGIYQFYLISSTAHIFDPKFSLFPIIFFLRHFNN